MRMHKSKKFVVVMVSVLTLLLLGVASQEVYAAVSKNWAISGDYSLFNSGLGGEDVGVIQGLLGNANSLELTTSDSTGQQAVRMSFEGNTDSGPVKIYSGKRGSEIPRLTINGGGSIGWGDSIASLRNDQGGSLELGGKGTPYIDFKNDTSTDYDARLILMGNDLLTLGGATLRSNSGFETANASAVRSVNTSDDSDVGISWEGNQARIRIGGNGVGATNGLAIQQVGNKEMLQIDESGGVVKLTSDYGSICIGKC